MTTNRRTLGRLLVTLAIGAALAACTEGGRRPGRSDAGPQDPLRAGTGADTGRGTAPADGGSGPQVALTDQDLAPMDAYIRRRFWILGDDVEIVASKEYFIQNLSIAARYDIVRREDTEGPSEARSVLTFLGRPQDVNEQSAPRVMIGTGITVTARRRITIRFVRTTSADLPVRIRIAANGRASLGVGSEVQRREESIVVGAQLRRGPGGAYRYEEQ